MRENRTMSSNESEDASGSLPPSVAGKSAEQVEGILAMIDSGELDATPGQRAYLAGAAFALREQAKLRTAD
ncbi:hypothetical protein GCM10027405_05570 [Arthrobacter alkaliphilus]